MAAMKGHSLHPPVSGVGQRQPRGDSMRDLPPPEPCRISASLSSSLRGLDCSSPKYSQHDSYSEPEPSLLRPTLGF